MLKRMITYEDYNGTTRTEPAYFNLTQTELTKLHVSVDGGFAELLQRLIDAKNGKAIMENVDNILMMSYGVKSDDGRYLIKNDRVREEFKCSPMYDHIFYELVTNDEKAAEFIKGIMPADLVLKAMENPETAALLKKE